MSESYTYLSFVSSSRRPRINFEPYKNQLLHMYDEAFCIEYESEFVYMMEENPAVVVALHGLCDVVGFGVLCSAPESDDIYELALAYVAPAHRQRGIYKHLVQERIEIAKLHGMHTLQTFPLNDASGHVDYLKRIGFEEDSGNSEFLVYRV